MARDVKAKVHPAERHLHHNFSQERDLYSQMDRDLCEPRDKLLYGDGATMAREVKAKVQRIQGYLTYKNTHSPRTLT